MDKSTGSKLENFWYHYKIPTVIIAAAVVFLTVVGIQIASKENYDLYVLYAGPTNVNETYSTGTAISKKMEKGFAEISGDEQLKSAIQSFVWVNDSLAAEYKKNDVYVNAGENRKTLQTVMDAVASGKSALMLLDRDLYDRIRDMGALEKLSDVLGYEPEGAIDEYGIRLSDTAFGRQYAGFNELPADTVLCVRNLQNGFSLIGKSTGDKKWERQLDVIRSMMNYGREDLD